MKAMLGFLFFVLFLAGFALVMLQGRQLAGNNLAGGGSTIAGITWRPTHIDADVVPDGSGLFLEIDEDGSVRGHGGCNSLFATLAVAETGIRLVDLAATQMACEDAVMQRESRYLEVLGDTRRLQADRRNLRFLDDDGDVVIAFVPTERK